jgi:hypothetical protein
MAIDQSKLEQCVNAMRMLRALPPHDVPSNICAHDGYFANSITRDYDEDTRKEAGKIVDGLERRWQKCRERFVKDTAKFVKDV